ncbi:MAG TPA: type II toxin-antitoxin system RelE/ParE family toxin [Acidimicrobiia bacterium]|nr:type II toxin-antitoxin system RelE/ParE family toxin [Acidimicrobiia bacterium]
MSWEILFTDQFGLWWDELSQDQQEALTERVLMLAEVGPSLGRPIVDSIENSRHHNMKELRASKEGALRVLFCFDPLRRAVLLLGGDKSGQWNAWYKWAIPSADDLFDEYLQDIKETEGD